MFFPTSMLLELSHSYWKTQAFFDIINNVPSFYIDLGEPTFELLIWQPNWLKLFLLFFIHTIINILLITTVQNTKTTKDN